MPPPAPLVLRQFIHSTIRDDSELNAFLIDHFDHVYAQISDSMQRTTKINILFCIVPNADIWKALKLRYKDAISKNKELMAPNTTGSKESERISVLRQQLEQLYQDRDTFKRWRVDPQKVEEAIRNTRKQIWRGAQPQEQDILDDRWVLIQELGKGSFGTVWLAAERSNRELTAIKILHGHYNQDEGVVDRFNRSAEKMKTLSLSTRSVVKILQKPSHDSVLDLRYFVMEHLPNGTLHQAVIEKKIDKRQALQIVLDISRAVEVAHKQSLIHRDIKPSNILLDEKWKGKLSDFDLLRDLNETLPSTMGRHGTVGYAAPECLERDRPFDHRADIYSLAITIIFAITGKSPTLMGYYTTQKTIDQLEIDTKFKSILLKASALEPDQRLGSVKELSDYIENHLNNRTLVEFEADFPEEGETRSFKAFDFSAINTTTVKLQPKLSNQPLSFLDNNAAFSLRILTGEHKGYSYPIFAKSTTLIGRSAECDLQFSDDMISKQHATISEEGGSAVIQDLSSVNGTYVNARPVTNECRLSHGDKIAIGGNVIIEFVQPSRLRR